MTKPNFLYLLYIYTLLPPGTATAQIDDKTNTKFTTLIPEKQITSTIPTTNTASSIESTSSTISTNAPEDVCSYHPFIVFVVQRTDPDQVEPGKYKKIATGVLISLQWVMTARSRTDLLDTYFMEMEVFAGSTLEVDHKKGEIRHINGIHKHKGHLDDLALIKLKKPFKKTNPKIAPARLPPERYYWKSCTKGHCFGFNIHSSLDKHLLCQMLTFCPNEKMSDRYACVKMEINEVNNLMAIAGSAVFCQNDIFVGMVAIEVDKPDKQVLSIDSYMTWIHDTTGLAVNFSSKPPSSKSDDLCTTRWFIGECVAVIVLLSTI